jgi:hypothetical protein
MWSLLDYVAGVAPAPGVVGGHLRSEAKLLEKYGLVVLTSDQKVYDIWLTDAGREVLGLPPRHRGGSVS